MQGFCGNSYHWTYNHAVYCAVITAHHQNMEVSVFLNTSFFCFEKLLLTWISRFLWIPPSVIILMPLAWWCHQNQKIFVCLNAECFCLKLLLTCLLRDDVIKTRKFVFIWMVIAPFCLINFRWHEFLDFCGNNHVIYEPIIPWMLIAHWHLQIRDISLNVGCLYLSHKLFLTWNSNFL